MVPRLLTALSGPLSDLERRILDQETAIEQWLREWWRGHEPPFYASVDLRNAGYKLAPVDTNLFPGGFNNLNPASASLCLHAITTRLERLCPQAKKILLIPENHTRNMHYLANVAHLSALLRHAGFEVRVGFLQAGEDEPVDIALPEGRHLHLEPLRRIGDQGLRLGLDDFDPCAILLNNDLSGGIPDVLRGLEGQMVIPPLSAGWHSRRKSGHFAAYRQVTQAFADLLNIDPWLVDPDFEVCGRINFHEGTGEECLANRADMLLSRIREKYAQYHIRETPFVIVKADAGTYGMGVMTVRDASEIKTLSRRQRKKMAVVKEGLQVQEVIIQEGVPTIEQVDDGTAEPVVYMIDRYVVGGFYRIHAQRGVDENLNAPGMHFQPLAFETDCMLPDCALEPEAPPNRFYAYGVIARLALAAAALELQRT
jgi:glutamate--cysteine ligase